jgi:hypothetical protein
VSVQPLRRRRAPRGSGEQLREEILDATTELLLETGQAKAVSIRSVAQRVGVTPPSHWNDPPVGEKPLNRDRAGPRLNRGEERSRDQAPGLRIDTNDVPCTGSGLRPLCDENP